MSQLAKSCVTHLMSFSCEQNWIARLFVTCRALFFLRRALQPEAKRLLRILHRGLCIGRAWSRTYPAHLPHVQLLAGTVRGWASLSFFFVRCLAPVQGRAGVRVLCFFFVWTWLKRVVSSSVCETVDQSEKTRHDKQIGRCAGREETRLIKVSPLSGTDTTPSCLDK